MDELDEGYEKDYQTWQYSLTQNRKPTDNHGAQFM